MYKKFTNLTEIQIFLFCFLFSFFSWFFFYKLDINQLPLQSEDIVPSIFTGISIVEDGTLYLNKYYEMMISKYPQPDDSSLTPYYLIKIGDNYLTAFPIMSSIVTLPIFWIYSFFVESYNWEDIYNLSHLTGSFVIALSSSFLYFFFRTHLKSSKKVSLILTSIYYFGTINLPLLSQGLWQHGTVQLFIILGLIFFFRKNFLLSFLFFGFGVLSRPTSLLILVVFLIFLLLENTKIKQKIINLLYSSFGVLIPIIFFLIYNTIFYVDISNQGYSTQLDNSWLGNFPESFVGMWFSPSKGILIYSPVLIFTLIGIYYGFKKNKLVFLSFIIILVHTLILSKWKHWYGGYGYGYRMVSDILPFFIFPIWFILENYYEKSIKPVILTFSISVIIQLSGLVFFDSIWHNAYDRGFRNTSWLWSITDSEAAFNIRRVLVKMNFLDKACEKCQ